MKKLPALVFAGAGALALAGSAIAATPERHIMNVPLPDGSVAHIEYVGNVAPKVRIDPAVPGEFGAAWMPMRFPVFPDLGRIMAEMNRQTQAMIQQVRQAPRQALGGGSYAASYGNMPAGASSYSMTSVSNGSVTCTRSTQVVSQGVGKPPKVTTSSSGDCGPAATAPSSAPPTTPPDRT